MKDKRKKRKVTLLIIILTLMCTVVAGFDSAAFTNVRNIDIAKIFICGLFTGVLIMRIKDIVSERKES